MYRTIDTQQTIFQQYRISVIETWPEGALKDSALAAARAALERELHYGRAFGEADRRGSTRPH